MTTEQFPGVRPDIARAWQNGCFELPSTGCPGCSDGRRFLQVAPAGSVYRQDEIIDIHDVFCTELPPPGPASDYYRR